MKVRCTQCNSELPLPKDVPGAQYNCPRCNAPLPIVADGVPPGSPPIVNGYAMPPSRETTGANTAIIASIAMIGVIVIIPVLAIVGWIYINWGTYCKILPGDCPGI